MLTGNAGRLSCLTSSLALIVHCNAPLLQYTGYPAAMSPLLRIPRELLLAVCAYLPVDGLLALKLGHPNFNGNLFIAPHEWPKHKISQCSRLAIRTYLTSAKPPPTLMRCILCNAQYPTSLFCSSSSPICTRRSLVSEDSEAEVLELPPRMCCWHASRLTRYVTAAPDGKDEWVSSLELMCMHCGYIQGWTRCNCYCDSCAFRVVCTYTRFLNKHSRIKSFTFWRSREGSADTAGQDKLPGTLYAREVHHIPGTSAALPKLPEH